MSTRGFYDARCKCGEAVGWFGTLADRPKCRKCGHRPPQEELDAAQAKIDAMLSPENISAEMAKAGEAMRQMRLRRGITLRRACEIISIGAADLCSVERGRKDFTFAQRKAFENMCASTPTSGKPAEDGTSQ